MAHGAAGCGYEYRNSNMGSGNGYKCNKLKKTRDGFYCNKFSEHLGWKECHEGEDLTIIVKHPFRCSKCTDSVRLL